MRPIAAAVALALSGCATQHLPAAEGIRFDPMRFFYAPTAGTGTLHKLVGKSVRVEVDSVSEGDLQRLSIVQTIREGDKPPRQRTWVIRRVGGGHYAGTLTDAAGPVDIRIDGGRAFIRYRSKDGLLFRQELALQPHSLIVCNRLTVRKFGIQVAQLNETIRRLPFAEHAPDPCPW